MTLFKQKSKANKHLLIIRRLIINVVIVLHYNSDRGRCMKNYFIELHIHLKKLCSDVHTLSWNIEHLIGHHSILRTLNTIPVQYISQVS